MRYLFATLLLTLAACGGGGCNPCEPEQEQPRATTDPVKCADNPKLCG